MFCYNFINYLIENKIYLDDAKISKGIYLNQLFYHLSHIMIMDKINGVKIDCGFNLKLDDE